MSATRQDPIASFAAEVGSDFVALAAELLDRVLVMGAGTMGHAIAQVFACAGLWVHLVDTDPAALRRAMRRIRQNLEFLGAQGELDPAGISQTMGRIIPSSVPPPASEGVQFAVEAVLEDPSVKAAVLALMERHLPANAVIASNTSSLDIFALPGLRRPQRLVAAHWFVPAYIIPLVEVAGGEETSPAALGLTVDLLKRVGKEPVRLKRFVPSFIVNRLQFVMTEAVLELLDNGWAEAEEIDRAVKSSLGIRLPLVGAAQTLDFTGLDLVERIMRARGLDSPTLKQHLEQGWRGVKDGAGLFSYQGRSEGEVTRERDRRYLKMIKMLAEIEASAPL